MEKYNLTRGLAHAHQRKALLVLADPALHLMLFPEKFSRTPSFRQGIEL